MPGWSLRYCHASGCQCKVRFCCFFWSWEAGFLTWVPWVATITIISARFLSHEIFNTIYLLKIRQFVGSGNTFLTDSGCWDFILEKCAAFFFCHVFFGVLLSCAKTGLEGYTPSYPSYGKWLRNPVTRWSQLRPPRWTRTRNILVFCPNSALEAEVERNFSHFCWFRNPASTGWYGKCPIIYRVSYIPGG